MDAFRAALVLTVKSMALGTRWAGRQRRLWLETTRDAAGNDGDLRKRVVGLQAKVERLMSQNTILRARLRESGSRKPYSWWLRLRIVWHLEYFGVPRRRIKEHLGVPRGTLYRWLKRLTMGDPGKPQGTDPVNKTPRELAEMIWGMVGANPPWGRRRIAMAMRLLGIFIAVSTVRNVLLRPRPRPTPLPAASAQPKSDVLEPRQVVARYPGHVWSVDRTRVCLWGLWPTWLLVAIDHYSRKVVVATAPVTDAAGCAAMLEAAFREHVAPKHLVSDQESIFTSEAVRELLTRWDVRHRFGAVGRQGSIAVTERVIWTLKHEWLGRVALISGAHHLRALLDEFASYYNEWRPHTTLSGATPETVWLGNTWRTSERAEKAIPPRVERRWFADTRVMAYRLPQAA